MFNLNKNWKNRYVKYYRKSKWPVIVDIASIFSVLALLALFISLYLYNPEILINPNIIFNKKPEIEVPNYVLDINNPPLNLDFSFEKKYISQDDLNSTLTLTLKNSSTIELKDIKININNPDFLKIDKIELLNSSENVKLIDNNKIKIDSVKPETEDSLALKITWINPNLGGRVSDLNVSLNYSIKDQDLKSDFNIKTPKLETILRPQALVLYTTSSGDKLGTGPLPPVAQLPTNYWLFFQLESFVEASDFIMSAKLAKGVNLTGNSSLLAGDFSYDEETRMIFWKIKDSESSKNQTSPRFGLEIQFIPEDSQVGSLANLLENISYFAKDSVSGKDLKANLGNIKTDIPDDIFNKGQGIVQSLDL